MTLDEFKAKYSEIYNAIWEEAEQKGFADGVDKGFADGEAKGKAEGISEGKIEGAKAERQRIQDVEAQCIPGHEKLIHTLKFDGVTTGEQAAVQILRAEKEIRSNVARQLEQDAPDAVAPVVVPEIETTTALPEGPDKWKVEFEKDPKIQAEFKTYEIYAAFRKGVKDGRVKIFGKEVK